MGHGPGFVPRYSNKEFRIVERLEVSHSFYTDIEGAFKANPQWKWESPYKINTDGFRSVPFEPFDDGKLSILLLGDSFCWGNSAEPITESFADILSRHNYRVYNTGIPGADPKQYAYLSEKYTSILKPDIVAVVLYMGNDIHPFRPMLPHKNLLHVTNVGILQAFDENMQYLTAAEAYNHYMLDANLAHNFVNDEKTSTKGKFRRFLFKTAAGTNLWVHLSKLKSHSSALFRRERRNVKMENRSQVSSLEKPQVKIIEEANSYLLKIVNTAQKYNAKFALFVIPVNPKIENESTSLQRNLKVFSGLHPFIPQNLETSDYMKLPNDHFNNSGHRKFAEFMLNIFKSHNNYSISNK